MEQFISIFSGGADIATYAIFYLIWKIEKRVFHLELKNGINK
tara:strand:- start:2652 stop:2777 length:126 start_codon:yes stop_codon:yes gene_type:complete